MCVTHRLSFCRLLIFYNWGMSPLSPWASAFGHVTPSSMCCVSVCSWCNSGGLLSPHGQSMVIAPREPGPSLPGKNSNQGYQCHGKATIREELTCCSREVLLYQTPKQLKSNQSFEYLLLLDEVKNLKQTQNYFQTLVFLLKTAG